MVRTTPDDDHDRKLLSDIEEYGWHLVAIKEDEVEPAYVFSVGMFHTLGKPELCMFGLHETKVMGEILNNIGQMMRDGTTFVDGDTSDEILEGYNCVFRTVKPQLYAEYFGYDRWYYEGDDFPMLQCVWPDKDGKFPWESDFDSAYLPAQPIMATKSPWCFDDEKDKTVFTTRQVIDEGLPIHLISHETDGDWQFLCGTTDNPDDCVVIHLSHMVDAYPLLSEFADLPMGWQAELDDESGEWFRFEMKE